MGRHIYACFFVLCALDREAKAFGTALVEQSAEWIRHRGDWYLKLVQRQLGHLSDETTFEYLRLISTAIGNASVSTNWQISLSVEGD
jgi:hypothetical protein